MHRPPLAALIGAVVAAGFAPAQGHIDQGGDRKVRLAAPRTPRTPAEFRARLAAKLEGAWLKAARWHTDYDAARAEAARSKRKLLIYFTRSYLPQTRCDKLEAGLFTSPQFRVWSDAHVLFAHITARIPGRKHDGLLKAKGFSTLPTIVFANPWGEVIAVHEGKVDIASLSATHDKADRYLALKKQAAAGNNNARHQLLVADLGFRRYDFAHGSLRLAAMESMPADLRRRAEQHLIDIQYEELIDALAARMRTLPQPEFRRRWDDLTFEFFRANRIPTGHRGTNVIMRAMNRARAAEDPVLFEQALDGYKQRHGGEPHYARRIALYEDQLAALRAKTKG